MNYINEANRTDAPNYDLIAERLQDEFTLKILHAAMGMVTEAGELMDAMKKHIIYGKPIDIVNVAEEMGDSFWYQALLAKTLGVTFEQVQEVNIKKLKARYPDKFTEHSALNRDLDNERKILENGNMNHEKDKSVKIVEVVLKNLKARKGFQHLLESIEMEDDETYQEIKKELEAEVYLELCRE